MFDNPIRCVACAAALFFGGTTVAVAQPPGPGAAATAEADAGAAHFLETAASAGRMEVELGRMAGRKASDPGVRAFGQAMAKHHTEAGDRLTKLASQKGIALPAAMLPEHRAQLDRLSGLSGIAFDREYMRLMVEDHARSVEAFETRARAGADADIQSFVNATLPGLREHLELAREVVAQQEAGAR